MTNVCGDPVLVTGVPEKPFSNPVPPDVVNASVDVAPPSYETEQVKVYRNPLAPGSSRMEIASVVAIALPLGGVGVADDGIQGVRWNEIRELSKVASCDSLIAMGVDDGGLGASPMRRSRVSMPGTWMRCMNWNGITSCPRVKEFP